MDSIDKLTNLYNEKYLKIALEQEVLRTKRFEREFSLLQLSLIFPEKVKQDMLYRVLKQVGSFIKMYTRSIDIGVRYGDNVLVILPETPFDGAQRAGDKIKEQIEKHIFIHQDKAGRFEFNVTVEVKIATYPKDGNDRKSLMDFLKNE